MIHLLEKILASDPLYLDPGSGSFIFQILIAALLGASAMIGIYWRKLKALLTGKKEEPEQKDDDTGSNE